MLAPETIHRGIDELPFVDNGKGTHLQVCQVDLATGIWTVRTRFEPGITLQTHRHTGHVYAFTETGSWHYLESPEAVNRPGSYLYEPANSVHTLHVPASNDDVTNVAFVIWGANLNLDDDGSVETITDAPSVLENYRAMCLEQHGLADPPVVVIDAH